MIRSSSWLYPSRAFKPLRHAATLLLLRPFEASYEVLMTRRSDQARFAAGQFVFPGGAVDAEDAALLAQSCLRQDQIHHPHPHLATAITAIRETFEELGILLAVDANDQWVTPEVVAQIDRTQPLSTQLAVHQLRLAVHTLHWLCRWVADRDLPIRFDVPFWMAIAPPYQVAQADETEQFEPIWITPAAAHAQYLAGTFAMIFPTVRTIAALATYPTLEDLFASCQQHPEQGLWLSCPRSGWITSDQGQTQESRHMEQDAPFGELALVAPYGQMVHDLTWQHERVVPLLKQVHRLTAPNPSLMTGPGTNTYLIGDVKQGYFVIDPGPDDAEHVERLFQFTQGHIKALMCTHSHPDHAPAAQRLRRCVEAAGYPPPPIVGLPSGPHARKQDQFTPTHAIVDGEIWSLDTLSLQAITTPGHAANHVCWLLMEDGLLFAGDHILNGATPVIAPPDGHMGAYLQSLDRLEALCLAHDVLFILPAHGYVLGDLKRSEDFPMCPPEGGAVLVIQRLRQHRLRRQAKVASAMQQIPHGTLQDWLPLVYNDVPSTLWPIALGSLQAHVDYENNINNINNINNNIK